MKTRRGAAWMLCATLALSGVSAEAETLYGAIGGPGQSGELAGAVVTIDPSSGEATVLGTPISATGITGLAVDSAGRLLGATANPGGGPRLIEIDPETGGLVAVLANLTFDGSPMAVADLAYDPIGGKLLGCSASSGQEEMLLSIDMVTGVMTDVGTVPGSGGKKAMGFGPTGTLYMLTSFDSTLYTLDPDTGAPTDSVSIGPSLGALGLTVRPSDQQVFFTEATSTLGRRLYRTNPATGNTLLMGPSGLEGNIHDLAFLGEGEATIVEAPALSPVGTALLLAMLMGGAAALVRRRPV